MTIRQYFEGLEKEATMEDLEEIMEYEEDIFHLMEKDYDRFVMWAIEEGIDLEAVSEGNFGTYNVLQSWVSDMRGE